MNKNKKSNNSNNENPSPEIAAGNSSDLSAEAARIDAAAADVTETQSPVDAALVADSQGGEEKPKRGRPPGSKTGGSKAGKPSKKEMEAAEKQQTEAFMRNALGAVVTHSVTLAKQAGWTSPAQPPLLTEVQWCESVAVCLDAVIAKYLPDAFDNYKEEAALLLLIAPWVTSNIMRIANDARKNRSGNRIDGKRQDGKTIETDSVSAAPNPN